MTEQQRASNSDTQRSILHHLMFGVLFVLILMNWEVYRVPGHKPFVESMNLFVPGAIDYNDKLAYNILDAYVREQENGQPNLHLFTKFVEREIDSVLIEIEALNKETNNNEFIDLGDKIAKRINYLRDSSFRYFGKVKDSAFAAGFSLDSGKLDLYKNLFSNRFSGVSKIDRVDRMAVLNSLKVDVVLTEEFLLYQIWNRIHDDGWNFDGFCGWFISDSSFSCQGNTFRSQILLVKNLPRERWNFKKRFFIKVDDGIVDTIPYDNKFTWRFRSKGLGLNFIDGSINVQYDSVNVTRPFSFSYFVSAPGIAMHADKANVCYVGVDNPVSIHIPGYPAEKLKLKVAYAKVTKKEDGLFEVYFDKIPKGKVYAYVDATNEKDRTSRVHSMELRVKELPPPITNFDAYKESGMQVDSFFRKESLEVFAADSAFTMDYEVISFQVEGFTAKHQYFGPITVYGEEFSGNHELVSILNTISAGDRLIISDIRVRAANGRIYEAAPVSVLLK